MKDYIIILPLAILFLLIKSTIFYWMPLPDVLLIIVFHLAITRPTAIGVILTFIIGYLSDAFTGGVMGVTSFSLIVVYVFTYLFSHKLQIKSRNAQTIMLGLFSLVKGLVIYYLILDMVSFAVLYKVIIPTALMTGLFAPAIITILLRLDERFELNKFRGTFH